MLKKYGRFFADWFDEHGARKRKSFPTRKHALTFQEKQRQLVTTKKARRSTISAASSQRGRN